MKKPAADSRPSGAASSKIVSTFAAGGGDSGSGATKAESSDGGGIFKVTEQVQKDPVVEIVNEIDADIKITLTDIHGISKSEIIAASSTRKLTVPEGSFTARLESSDANLLPTDGTVVIHNYRHYSAELVVGNQREFHIGD